VVAGGRPGSGSGGLIAPPSAPANAGGGADPSSSSASSSSGGGSGDVRGESEDQLPPPLENGPDRRVEPGGLSLAIGIALIVLALVAGFATPHLRARLRSGRPA
jgi:hypothetical protein